MHYSNPSATRGQKHTHTLHSITSLHHQSSTQSKLEYSNSNYNDFDIDYSAPESLADQPLNNGDAVQVLVIEKMLLSAKYNTAST